MDRKVKDVISDNLIPFICVLVLLILVGLDSAGVIHWGR